ncbi:Shedu immune nuclease family protein [Peptostreptococcus stomatis]|uniref:Shedu immune nuclease family protein n=1 Tax=Peptostreptococcus stomatis TaxID=341694 RepID=UPI0028D8B78B|nr:Shedu immune nuclease family protein [Peptostreptococcus stomatis]
MAKFTFKKDKEKLKCIYQFDGWVGFDLEKLNTEDGIPIRRTFFINRDTKYKIIDDDTIEFVIGELDGDYYKLDKNVFQTNNIFYFQKDFKLKVNYFFQLNKISILRKIDKVIANDLYIGGKVLNAIPEDIYINMIKNFPNTTECIKYQNMRIEFLCESYISPIKNNKQDYIDYVNKKDEKITNVGLNINEKIVNSELFKYKYILSELKVMLNESEKYSEDDWQMAIAKILMLLNSNYIGFLEKLRIPIEEEGEFREPDFLLVDASGFIDIIEIKKADNIQILNKREYRNNFIPSQELSGAIMQCNKYCFWLTQNRKNNEALISKKIKEKYGIDMNIRSPKFTIILGRSIDFTERQKKDFKTIKNQYNYMNEILTYDDIIIKLERIIGTFLNKIN